MPILLTSRIRHALALALLLVFSGYPNKVQAGDQSLGLVDRFESSLRDKTAESSIRGKPGTTSSDGVAHADGALRIMTPNECKRAAHPWTLPEDQWEPVKWILPPAPCPVQGIAIEVIDPKFNFRRGYALGFVDDTEDKTHLLPYLRAARDLSLSTRRRRVLLDLGAKTFVSSVLWFLRMYPIKFTEIHAFELLKKPFRVPRRTHAKWQGFDEALDKYGRTTAKVGIPDSIIDLVHFHQQFVDLQDIPAKGFYVQHVDIIRFIKEELALTRDDTVIVKMDIEGGEWPILEAWMEDKEMPQIIDEIFVEAHYRHPSMAAFKWNTFSHTQEEAGKLLEDLRRTGFFAHFWP